MLVITNPSNNTYYDYANGSDTAPTPVSSGTDPNTAVYAQGISPPADVNLAGGLSPYGVMGLGGNVWEWEESSGDLANSDGAAKRGFRGGYWYDSFPTYMNSSTRNSFFSTNQKRHDIGFRVVNLYANGIGEVPEPTTLSIFGLGILGIGWRSRHRKKVA